MAPIPATAAEGVVRTGWLYKCGHNVKGWKLRYFVLDQNELRYYKKDKDKKPAGGLWRTIAARGGGRWCLCACEG